MIFLSSWGGSWCACFSVQQQHLYTLFVLLFFVVFSVSFLYLFYFFVSMRSVKEWRSIKVDADLKDRLEALKSSFSRQTGDVWGLNDVINFLELSYADFVNGRGVKRPGERKER